MKKQWASWVLWGAALGSMGMAAHAAPVLSLIHI